MPMYTIQQVDSPGPKGWAKLHTNNGILQVPPKFVGQFQVGTTVDITTAQQTWGRGTERESTVTVVGSGPGGTTTGLNRQNAMQAYQPPSPRVLNTGFQPRAGNLLQEYQLPKSPQEARNIFVTGVVEHAMSSGKYSASEMRVLTQEAMACWEILNPKPVLQSTPALNGDPGPSEAV